jgi:NTP pyrophosphatase (non-canonical NTP hydrolase)
MNDEIEAFKKVVADAVSKKTNFDEDAFNLGVEFGRLLQKNNLTNFRLQTFIDKEEKSKRLGDTKDIQTEIEKLVGQLAQFAIKATVKDHYSLTFDSTSDAASIELPKEIEDKFLVAYDSTDQNNEDDDFKISFHAVGELKKVLNKHKVRDNFTITLWNLSNQTEITITMPDDLSGSFKASGLGINIFNGNHNYEDLQELLADVKAVCLFPLLSQI